MQRKPIWIEKTQTALKASLTGASDRGTSISSVFNKNKQDEGYTITFRITKIPGLFLDLAKFQSIFRNPSIMLDVDESQILVHGVVDDIPINAFIKIA